VNEDAAELRVVSTVQIERVMRHAVGSNIAELGDWEWQPLPYHAVLPDRTLARVTGVALLERHERVPWSSVVKVIRRTAVDEQGEITSGMREILAYGSGLLVDLPGHCVRRLSLGSIKPMLRSGCGWRT
jgi:hypothetical protein